MKTKATLFIALFLMSLSAFAQKYNTAIGARLSSEGLGLTVNQRILPKVAIEGIAVSNLQNRTSLTAMVKKHNNLIGRRLNWYVGGGAHTSIEQREYVNNSFGFDGVVGMELTLLRMNLSVDYKPTFNVAGGVQNFQHYTGVSARFVLFKDKSGRKK